MAIKSASRALVRVCGKMLPGPGTSTNRRVRTSNTEAGVGPIDAHDDRSFVWVVHTLSGMRISSNYPLYNLLTIILCWSDIAG
jgi:hypothetical protein